MLTSSVFLALALSSASADWGSFDGSLLSVPANVGRSRIDHVFSRTISYRAAGFDDLVFRASGTASYRLTGSTQTALQFDISYRYDGAAQGQEKISIDKSGDSQCVDGKCTALTDASGLLYNKFLWGDAAEIRRRFWEVKIPKAWELGPPGVEQVQVIRLDSVAHLVVLQREGHGEGYSEGDKRTVVLKRNGSEYNVEVVPGESHWIGMAQFIDGFVESDELMVERSVVFKSKELGNIAGSERQYILLNHAKLSPQS